MRRAVFAILICAALAACQKGQPDEVDAEAIGAVEAAVEEQLNAPGLAVMAVLRAAAEEPQVGWDTLFITPDEEPEPINWWLQRRGLIEFSGAQFATRAAFTLSKSALELVAQPDQPWFEAVATTDPVIDCESDLAMEARGCEVKFEVTPELTPIGRASVGQPATSIQPISISAVVSLGLEDWEVTNLAAETGALQDIALTHILGSPEQRLAAFRSADDGMKGRLAQLAGEAEPVVNLEAYAPPTYVEPPPPVAPAATPSAQITSPFRPGQ